VRGAVERGIAGAESNGGFCLLYDCGCVRDCSGKPDPLASVPYAKGERPKYGMNVCVAAVASSINQESISVIAHTSPHSHQQVLSIRPLFLCYNQSR
jgi:hypothetical protein